MHRAPTAPTAIVVGGGVMGASCAYWLTRLGRHVTVVDQFDAPNSLGASGDHVRVFRLTYGKDSFYTEMAAKSLPLWLALNAESGQPLLVQNGLLDLAVKAKGYEEDSWRILKEMNIPVQRIEKAELRRHYPMINSRAVKFAVFHKDGGMIWASKTVETLLHLAQKKGAKLRPRAEIARIVKGKDGIEGLKDVHGHLHKADAYVFCPGAWTDSLLKGYRLPLKVTRQQQLYLRPPSNRGRYRPEHFPVFAALSTGFYGFPLHIHGFLKIGDHKKGPPGRPGPGADAEVTPQFVNKCRAFLKRYIPDLAGFTEMESKVCYYTSTPNDDFILDRLPDAPNGFVAAGFSGHGFKFAPLIGKTMAELVVGGRPELNLHRFRIGRFRR